MTHIEAFILPSRNPGLERRTFGGLHLAERAVLALHRGGIDRIVLSREIEISPGQLERLRRRGVRVEHERDGNGLTPGSAAIALSTDVIVEPGAVRSLLAALGRSGRPMVAASEASPGTFAAFAAGSLDDVDVAAATDQARSTRLSGGFCQPLHDAAAIPRVERDYVRRSNGSESITTRIARRVSLPLTRQFLRLGMSANQVTILGFALAIVSAVFFAHRTYWYGVAGALIYFLSMVLDCSDGEVARLSFSDSKFGAWLETVTDYLSYFVVMGGLVAGEILHHGVCHHVQSAAVAAAASLLIVIVVGYLRGRVASENPGAFDDALSAELRTGSTMQRFAVWGRQLIKRSFFAHLVVFQAAIGHLAALLTIWAYGGVAALIVVLAVQSAIISRLKVAPIRIAATFPTGRSES